MAFLVAIPVAGIPHDPQVTNPIGIRYTAAGSDEFNDMQMYIFEQFASDLAPGLALDLPVPSVSVVPGLQRPRSRGRVRLRSADADVPPQIDLNYLDDPEDMRRMVDGMRIAWRLTHEGPLAAMLKEFVNLTPEVVNSDSALKTFLRDNCSTIFHPSRHRQDGPRDRSDGCRRSALPRARRSGPASSRRLDNAKHSPRQHQPNLHNDR